MFFNPESLHSLAVNPEDNWKSSELFHDLPSPDREQLIFLDKNFTKKFSDYMNMCYPFCKYGVLIDAENNAFLRKESYSYEPGTGNKSLKKWFYNTGIPFSTIFLVECHLFSILISFKLFIRHFVIIERFMHDARAIDLSQRFLFVVNHENYVDFASMIPDKLNNEQQWQQFTKLIHMRDRERE